MIAFQLSRFLFGSIAVATALFSGAGNAWADNHFTVGVEGFYDDYKEPSGNLTDTTNYGSVTAGYMHEANGFFSKFDGRYSYGTDHYESVSGTSSGAPQYEGEFRATTGIEIVHYHGMLMPYIGLGVRQFFDQGKEVFTDTGAEGYDRHITQLYAPLGVSYPFTSGNWTLTPNIEADVLLYGRVSTHLGEVPGYYNVTNTQHAGVGFRSEFMVGQQYHYFGWQAGPFIRYWTIRNSNLATSPPTPEGSQWEEPKNTRLQAGMALRLTY